MTRIINLPTGLSQHALRHFLTTCNFGISKVDTEITICSPKGMLFAEPFALAMLAAFGDDANSKGIALHLDNPSISGLKYAKRMHLFEHLHTPYKHDVQEREEAGRFIPISKVLSSEDLKEFISRLMPLWHLPEESAAAVSYCVSELVRNVLEHSRSAGAFVCAQYFPKKSRVAIGVADRGQGVLSSLLQNYPGLLSDEEALALALRPGSTGSQSFENAGAGLFFTKSLAKLSNSRFSIYTGKACYRLGRDASENGQITLFADPLLDKHALWNDVFSWPGTVVAIDINTDKLSRFRSTLEAIREVYDKDKIPRPKAKIRFT